MFVALIASRFTSSAFTGTPAVQKFHKNAFNLSYRVIFQNHILADKVIRP